MNNNIHIERISKKKNGLLRFILFGYIIPIMIPISGLYFYNRNYKVFDTDYITSLLFFLIFILIVIGLIYLSYENLLKEFNKSEFNLISIEKTERKNDYILYGISIITIGIIAYQTKQTGGYDKSILIFYFYFIPSAIAISFEAKNGLYITIVSSLIAILYNYWTNIPVISMNSIEERYYKYLYSVVIAIHLISIGLLERFHNINIKKRSNEIF